MTWRNIHIQSFGQRVSALAATPHNGRRQPLPCCGGGDRTQHRRVRYSFGGATQGRRPTVRNDVKAFVLSLGGLLAVAGSALLVLWAMVS